LIYFASQLFSQINKFFSGSFNASPLNSGNLIVGSCPAILNVEILSPHGVDTWLMLPELSPPVVFPRVDVFLVVFLLPKFGCLNGGVLIGVLVAHAFMGSTLTLIWIGVLPSIPTLGPLVFLSYAACRIYSIFSTTQISSTSSSSLSKPSLATTTLLLVFILYW
jgi:hypothetical protein